MPSSDIDVIILATEPEAFRRDKNWPHEISWATQVHVIGWHDAAYGAVWSRHIQLSNGAEIEISFGERSWAATSPVDQSTSNIVLGGIRVLVDKEKLFERLKAVVGAGG